MVAVTFVDHEGNRQAIDAVVGGSLMESAVANGVEGILADCGGACACATCHIHVAPDWMAVVGPPGEDEAAMLDLAFDPDETSRLSCQIAVTEAFDGLVVTLPLRQI